MQPAHLAVVQHLQRKWKTRFLLFFAERTQRVVIPLHYSKMPLPSFSTPIFHDQKLRISTIYRYGSGSSCGGTANDRKPAACWKWLPVATVGDSMHSESFFFTLQLIICANNYKNSITLQSFLLSCFLLCGSTCSLRMPALLPVSQAGPMRNPKDGTGVVPYTTRALIHIDVGAL